jgi:hypothetical protein
MKIKKIIITCMYLTLLMGNSWAADLSGKEIMNRVVGVKNINSLSSNIKMILKGSYGNSRTIIMKTYMRDNGLVGRMSMINSPINLKGSRYLGVERKNGEVDQWAYLPKLRRVKRIPLGSKSSKFLGSDFSYYDFERPDVRNSKYKKIGNYNGLGGKGTIVLSLPNKKLQKISGYRKSMYFVRNSDWVVIKAKHWMKSNKIKYFEVLVEEEIDGVLIPVNSRMRTKNGKKLEHESTLFQTKVRVDKTIPDKYFKSGSLNKIKY